MDSINVELTVSGSPGWTYRKAKMHLPSVIGTLRMITHLDRETVEADENQSILTDNWEVDVLKPLPTFITRYLDFRTVQVRSVLHCDDRDPSAEWYVSVLNFEGLLDVCEGTITFTETPSGTRIEVRGNFDLDLSAVPGVPSLLAFPLRGRMGKLAERIINNYLPKLEDELESIDLEHTPEDRA